MQVHNTSRIGSYCENRRLTTMERTWSEGKTIFPIEPRQPRPIDKDPAEMTLEELVVTQDMELPTISRTSFMLTGIGTWSLEKPSPQTGRTIAELVPEDNPIHSAWQTAKPKTEMTVEELRAYEKWCAEQTRGTGLTPYKTLHPDKRQKIDWEKASAKNGPEIRRRYTRNHSGVPIIEIRGIKTDDKTFPVLAKDYLRQLRDEWGHVPTMEEIEERGAALRAERTEREENNVGIPKTWYDEVYLNGNHHLDPFNFDVFDAEYHSSYEYIADPDLDEFDEDFVRDQGLDPEEVIDAMPRELRTHIRSKRDQERVIRNPSHNDALWHARIGQAIELGLDFSREEGRTMGRVVRDAVDAAWSKISDPDKTGINALSTLKD